MSTTQSVDRSKRPALSSTHAAAPTRQPLRSISNLNTNELNRSNLDEQLSGLCNHVASLVTKIIWFISLSVFAIHFESCFIPKCSKWRHQGVVVCLCGRRAPALVKPNLSSGRREKGEPTANTEAPPRNNKRRRLAWGHFDSSGKLYLPFNFCT